MMKILVNVEQEEEFEITDKADLIRALLQSGGGTQRCITLAMDLATSNVTQDADIWKSILHSIVKFNMIDTARNLIKDISEIRLLWVNPVMAPVWNLILQSPFKHGKSFQFTFIVGWHLQAIFFYYLLNLLFGMTDQSIIRVLT